VAKYSNRRDEKRRGSKSVICKDLREGSGICKNQYENAGNPGVTWVATTVATGIILATTVNVLIGITTHMGGKQTEYNQ
jgi:hypothetical protein